MAWAPPAADQDWTPPSGDADLDAGEFKRRVGRDPNPAELASFRANPENWAGASGDGTTAGGMVNAAATGINSGLSTQLAGFPVDVAEQVKELGKAAIGAPYQAITGRPAPDWLQPDTNPEAVVGSSAYLAAKARQAGAGALIDPSQPTPTNQLINQGASMLAPSILEGGAVAADRALTRTRAAGEPPPAPAAEPPPPPPVDGPVTAADLKASPEKLTPAPEAPAAPGPKPKITPKAGESAQQAAARQGVAAPAPEAPAAPAAPASPKDAIHQLNADTGGALPEVRTSALTGDHAETAVDNAHSTIADEPGQRMAGVIQNENAALAKGSQQIVDSTGGQAAGTDKAALQDRGTVIDRALGGIRDWFDTNRKKMYADADTAAGGVPMTKFNNFHSVMSEPSNFTGAEGMQLHGDVQRMAQHFGLQDGNGFWKPTTAANIEKFRQWVGEQYSPRTGKAIKLLKDSLDNDVAAHGGTNFYANARALRSKQAAMLERENSISRLIPERNSDGSISTNRPVAVSDLPDHIAGLHEDQFNHLINTLHDSAKLGNGELAEGSAAAIRELKAHMAERLHEAGTGKPGTPQRLAGRWDSAAYHKKLDSYSLNLPKLFTPGEQARINTVRDAGSALHMDKSYPKTAELQRRLAAGTGSHFRESLAGAAVGGVESLATMGAHAIIPGSGVAVGPALELSGASTKARKFLGGASKAMKARAAEVEGRISKVAEPPAGAPTPRPLGQRVPGQGGWVGNRPEPGDVEGLGKNYPVLNHEYDKETGEHQVHSPGGGLTVADDVGPHIRVLRDDTPEEYQRQGHSVARQAKLVDTAAARGGRLQSDYSLSPAEAAVYEKMKAQGFDVQKNPNTVVNPGTGNIIDNSGSRTPVYSVGPKPVTDTRPLGQRLPNQGGGYTGKKVGPNIIERLRGEKTVSGEDVVKHLKQTQIPSIKLSDQDAHQMAGLDSGGNYKLTDYPVDQINADQPISTGVVKRYADKKTPFPAVVLDSDGKVRDGNHRIAAARLRGDKAIKAYVPIDTTTGKMAEAAAPVSDQPAQVNIGLHVNGGPAAGGSVLDGRVAKAALKSQGVEVGKTSIQNPPGGEPTLVADINRPLTAAEGNTLAKKTGQTAIAQRHNDGTGTMLGQGAQSAESKKNGWDKYNSDYFQMHDGRSATEHDAENAGLNAIKPHMTPEEIANIENRAPQHRATAIKNLMDVFHGSTSTEGTAAMALAGQAKKGWYKASGKAIHTVYGPDAPRFTALLAAMSPQTSVEMNFHNAIHVFKAWDEAGRPTSHDAITKIMEDNSLKNPESASESNVMEAWRQNGIRALTSKNPEHESFQLSGPKVNSFYQNLRDNVHEVTNDSWNAMALNVAQSRFGGAYKQVAGDIFGKVGQKSPGYMGASAKVRAASDLLTKMTGDKWTPHETQETMWSFAKTAMEYNEEAAKRAKAAGLPKPEEKTIPQLIHEGLINDDLIRSTPDFAHLFGAPEHSDVFASGSFAGGARKLAAQQKRSPAGPAAPSEKSQAAATALRPHLLEQADRLEGVRQQRIADKAAGRKERQIGNIQVPF